MGRAVGRRRRRIQRMREGDEEQEDKEKVIRQGSGHGDKMGGARQRPVGRRWQIVHLLAEVLLEGHPLLWWLCVCVSLVYRCTVSCLATSPVVFVLWCVFIYSCGCPTISLSLVCLHLRVFVCVRACAYLLIWAAWTEYNHPLLHEQNEQREAR